MSAELYGDYFVVPTATAINRARKLFPRERDYQLLRRHGEKLAWWPRGSDDGNSAAADLDCDWIKSLEEKRIGELRIDETIGGFNNLRIIFFKANLTLDGETMNRIWLLSVFQKKRQAFTNEEIRSWRAMRDLIVLRNYGSSQQA